MEQPETKRVSEAVEAGLRDGRTLDSLRRAMQESGYGDEEIKGVLSKVDRRRISRRPPRRKLPMNWIAAAMAIIVIISVGSYIFVSSPGKPPQNGMVIVNNLSSQGLRICYVLNESVKQDMIDAGAKCDKWYLIKEI
jgi:hypothetical protein